MRAYDIGGGEVGEGGEGKDDKDQDGEGRIFKQMFLGVHSKFYIVICNQQNTVKHLFANDVKPQNSKTGRVRMTLNTPDVL